MMAPGPTSLTNGNSSPQVSPNFFSELPKGISHSHKTRQLPSLFDSPLPPQFSCPCPHTPLPVNPTTKLLGEYKPQGVQSTAIPALSSFGICLRGFISCHPSQNSLCLVTERSGGVRAGHFCLMWISDAQTHFKAPHQAGPDLLPPNPAHASSP